MSLFERDGLSFNFEEHGGGIALIFSHGLGGNLTQVLELVRPLEGVRVIVYDNRGHGKTSGTCDPRKLTFACMADDMAAVLDHLRIESAVIGGESMGAGISLALARRHRQLARALVLSRPAWLNAPYPPNLAILGALANLIDDFGREHAPARFEQSPEFKHLVASYPETAKSLMHNLQESTPSDLALLYNTIPASAPFEHVEELSGIDTPTLILANKDDPIHPFEYAQFLADAIPRATLQEIPSKNRSVDEHRRVFRRSLAEFILSLHP